MLLKKEMISLSKYNNNKSHLKSPLPVAASILAFFVASGQGGIYNFFHPMPVSTKNKEYGDVRGDNCGRNNFMVHEKRTAICDAAEDGRILSSPRHL